MARTPYNDPEAEKAYQGIEKGSSKPSAPAPDDTYQGDNFETELKKPFRYDRPVNGR